GTPTRSCTHAPRLPPLAGAPPLWGGASTRARYRYQTWKDATMTEQGAAALDTALAYHRAWTNGDFDTAMTYIADDIVCLAPSGRHDGAKEFRAFMEPFTRILTRRSEEHTSELQSRENLV